MNWQDNRVNPGMEIYELESLFKKLGVKYQTKIVHEHICCYYEKEMIGNQIEIKNEKYYGCNFSLEILNAAGIGTLKFYFDHLGKYITNSDNRII